MFIRRRNTYWLGNYPCPMGELFDEGYLDRWRLEWAIRKAYDSRLREAAKLLLQELERRAQRICYLLAQATRPMQR